MSEGLTNPVGGSCDAMPFSGGADHPAPLTVEGTRDRINRVLRSEREPLQGGLDARGANIAPQSLTGTSARDASLPDVSHKIGAGAGAQLPVLTKKGRPKGVTDVNLWERAFEVEKRYKRGESVALIAASLNVSVASVYGSLAKCRKWMKQEFDDLRHEHAAFQWSQLRFVLEKYRKRAEQNDLDNDALEGIRKVVMDEAKLTGTIVEKHELTGKNGQPVMIEYTRAPITAVQVNVNTQGDNAGTTKEISTNHTCI